MLIIKREKSEVDKNEVYQIEINDINFGTIENEEIKQFDLKNGDYKIKISTSKFSSNIINFSMNNGEIIEIHCKPKYKNTTISKIWYQLIKKGIKLTIKQDIYL